jgi:hypothetical protein
MEEEILSFLSQREGATIGWLLAEFTVDRRERIRRRGEVFSALDVLVSEGKVNRDLNQKIGWIYSLPSAGEQN